MDASLQSTVPQYHYSSTGDVVMGSNLENVIYTEELNSRFPINARKGLETQGLSWDAPFLGEASPLYDAPVAQPGVFQGVPDKSVPMPSNA